MVVHDGNIIEGNANEFISFLMVDIPLHMITNFPVQLRISSWRRSTGLEATCDRKARDDVIDDILKQLLLWNTYDYNDIKSFSCDDQQWKISRCSAGLPAICVDCVNPCMVESELELALNYEQDFLNSSKHSLAVDFEPIIEVPVINSMKAYSMDSNTVSINLDLSTGKGVVKCAAYLSSVPYETSVPSSEVFKLIENSTEAHVSLRILKLEPSTSYDIHCNTLSPSQKSTWWSEQVLGVVTQCCKTISVKLLSSYFLDNAGFSNALEIETGPLLSDLLFVNVTCLYSASADFKEPMTSYPFLYDKIQLQFFNKSISTKRVIDYTPHVSGFYWLQVLLNGPAASIYHVEYPHGQSFEVITESQQTSAPKVISAKFSEEAIAIEINLDVNSDRGGVSLDVVTECKHFVKVAGLASTARCLWKNDAQLEVMLSSDSVVKAGSILVLKSGTLKAKCILDSCEDWKSNVESAVTIMSPNRLELPVVHIIGPNSIGPCDDMFFDISTSQGSGGRRWTSVTWSVWALNSNASGIAEYLNSAETSLYTYAIHIPSTLLNKKESYRVVAEMCNFLNACGTGYHSFLVGDVEEVPVVILHTPTEIEGYRHLPITLSGTASIRSCNGSTLSEHIKMSWKLFNTTSEMTLDSSIFYTPANPSVIQFPAHFFEVGQAYKLVLKGQHSDSAKYSTASIYVSVKRGNVFAKWNTSSSFGLRVDETVVIDASQSYDEDVPDATGLHAGLLFDFECKRSVPSPGVCDVGFKRISESIVSISVLGGDVSYVDHVYEITVYVSSDDGRRSLETVQVTIISSSSADISLSLLSPAKITLDQPRSKVMISATVQYPSDGVASWSLLGHDLGDMTEILSPTSVDLHSKGNSTFTNTAIFSLVALRKPTMAGGRYIFSLQVSLASGISSSSTIAVEMNTPPLPGVFTVTPSSGYEVETKFEFAAFQWMDPDLPLTFEFGAYSAVALSYFVLHTRSQLPTSVSILLAGQSSASYMCKTRVRVFDNFDGVSSDYTEVHVVSNSHAYLDLKNIVELLNVTELSFLRQAINIATGVINNVQCDNAPNCTQLNRQPCGRVAHKCGMCLPGYYGERKPSNTFCFKDDAATFSLQESRPLNLIQPEEAHTCITNAECQDYYEAECLSNFYCGHSMKQCDENCSNHGVCQYYSYYHQSEKFSECSVIEDDCLGRCSCVASYAGDYCEYEAQQFEYFKSIRDIVLESFARLIYSEIPSPSNVVSWIHGLVSVATSSSHLTESSRIKLICLTGDALSYAHSLEIPFEEVGIALNTILDIVLASRAVDTTSDGSLQLYKSVGLFMSQDLAVGQNSKSVVQTHFRMSALSISLTEETVLLSFGKTLSEFLNDMNSQSITVYNPNIIDGVVVKILIMETISRLYVDASNTSSYQSIPLEVVLNYQSILDNNISVEYPVRLSLLNFEFGTQVKNESFHHTIICRTGDVAAHNLACPSGVNATVMCDGIMNGSLVVECPVHLPASSCGVQSKSDLQCEVEYDERGTVCICVTNDAYLDAAFASISTASITEASYLYIPYSNHPTSQKSISRFQILNSAAFLLIIFWMLLIGILLFQLASLKRRDVCNPLDLNDYSSMLDDAVPIIFSMKSMFQRLYKVLWYHHRWISIWESSGSLKRLRWRFLAVLTQSNFVIVIFCAIFGFISWKMRGCHDLINKSACQSQQFHNGNGCYWNENDGCTDEGPPNYNWIRLLLIALLVSAPASPIIVALDGFVRHFLLCEIPEHIVDRDHTSRRMSSLEEEYLSIIQDIRTASLQLPESNRKHFLG